VWGRGEISFSAVHEVQRCNSTMYGCNIEVDRQRGKGGEISEKISTNSSSCTQFGARIAKIL
jgi:hypothetical protein